MLPIDRYAYCNGLSNVHPGEKFTFAVITLIICLGASDILTSLVIILIMAGAVIFRAGIPPAFYFKLITIPISFLVIGILTIAISVTRAGEGFLYAVSFGNFTVGVTGQSIMTAANLFFKSLGAVSCLYFLSLTTPMVEIILILKRLRVPVIFIELMTLIYRFIFVLMETAGQMYTAQSSRLGYRSLRLAYASLSQLIANLFIKAYSRANALSVTLMSRCYSGELNVLEPQYIISRKNILLIAAMDMALVLISLLGGGKLFWPNI